MPRNLLFKLIAFIFLTCFHFLVHSISLSQIQFTSSLFEHLLFVTVLSAIRGLKKGTHFVLNIMEFTSREYKVNIVLHIAITFKQCQVLSKIL